LATLTVQQYSYPLAVNPTMIDRLS